MALPSRTISSGRTLNQPAAAISLYQNFNRQEDYQLSPARKIIH
jgi:hypothetical protein